MKKFVAMILSVAMAACLLAGCGTAPASTGTSAADTPASTPASAATGEKTVITVTRWGEIEENDPEKMIIEKFNAENTMNIEVKYDVVPGDGYGDRLTTSFSSGEGYDIFASGEGDFYKWVDKSLTTPLDDMIAADTTWKNEMDKSIFEMGNINGKQHYLVRDYNPICLWYNKDVFDKYEVEYPTNDWTWDDLEAAAQKLTSKNADGTYDTFGFNAQTWAYASLSYLESNGLGILSEDGTTADGYLNSPELAASMEKYIAWSSGDNRISPTAADLDTFGDTTAMFIDGTLAMTLNGGWVKTQLDEANCNYGTALVPGNHNSYMCASAYAIGSRCKNPEAAWEVIKALTGAECTELRVQYSACLPTIGSQLDTLKGTIGEASMGLIDQIEYSVQPVGIRSDIGNPAVTAFNTAQERMIFNDGTTEEILNDAVAEVAEETAG